MNSVLQNLLKKYPLKSRDDYENALKEIIQELTLLGLWREKFYEHAAFYGGSALRMFYGLNRFSEDLDFSLLTPNPDFKIQKYCRAVEKELQSYGLHVAVDYKQKVKDSQIESAFIKAGTRINLISIDVPQDITSFIPKTHHLKIKFEIDIIPPGIPQTEIKTLLVPIPFQVRVFKPAFLFAGKIHAILCRPWKSRVKGRDYYDFLWFLGQDMPVDLEQTSKRMEQTGHLKKEQKLTSETLKDLLRKKFCEVDFEKAKEDVFPFLKDSQSLDLWSQEFFKTQLEKLRFYTECD